MDFENFFKERLAHRHAEGRYLVFAFFVRAYDHRIDGEVTVWCANAYLGMGQHPAIIDAIVDPVRALGAGSGGTRNTSGNTYLHELLEAEPADLHRREAALVFTSAMSLTKRCSALSGKRFVA
jgi:5-aminolevulinate synthase